MKPDTKCLKTIVEEHRTRVVVDLSTMGGDPSRFPDGFSIEAVVAENQALHFAGLPKYGTVGWLGFVPKNPRSKHARKAKRYIRQDHPLKRVAHQLSRSKQLKIADIDLVEVVAARLADDKEAVNRLTWRMQFVHEVVLERNLNVLWNGMWRRVLPTLNVEALKLARECVPDETYRLYNQLAQDPERLQLARDSRLLTLLNYEHTNVPPDFEEAVQQLKVSNPATKSWLRRQRLLPSYGPRPIGVLRWLQTVDEAFERFGIRAQDLERMTKPTHWLAHSVLQDGWQFLLPEFFADPQLFIDTMKKANKGKLEGTSGLRSTLDCIAYSKRRYADAAQQRAWTESLRFNPPLIDLIRDKRKFDQQALDELPF